MDSYKDLRIFSYDNGGSESVKLKKEYNNRYNSQASIRLPFKISGYNSFVMYNSELIGHLSYIYRLNNRINSLFSVIPKSAYDSYLVNSLIDEIQQSNEFENVESTRQEIEKAYENVNNKSNLRFMGMVNKYIMLITNKTITLNTSSDVRSLYNEFVLAEVVDENPNDYPDGEIFRKGTIGVAGKAMGIVHEGLYPESKIIETMNQALSLLNDEKIDVLIRSAIFHFMFGYIHPFYNGNGRMARFISSYKLSNVLNLAVCLKISYIIKERRNKYQRMFKEAEDKRNCGELTGFVIDFLELIREACDEVLDDIYERKEKYQYQLNALNKLFDNELSHIPEKYRSIIVFVLENTVFIGSGVSVDSIMKKFKYSKNTLNKVLLSASPYVYVLKKGKKNYWLINEI